MNAAERAAAIIEARRWWRVAAEDLRVVRACLSLDPPSMGNAAYHSQQAAEKLLKGLLTAAGVSFRKVHDLDELADAASPLHPALSATIDACRPFTAWATEYRYPPEDEAAPPLENDILTAVALLDRLLAATRDLPD